MFPATEAGLFYEAAGLATILSAVFAMISLGGLAVDLSGEGEPAPRGWVRLTWISWVAFIFSAAAFAALSPGVLALPK